MEASQPFMWAYTSQSSVLVKKKSLKGQAEDLNLLMKGQQWPPASSRFLPGSRNLRYPGAALSVKEPRWSPYRGWLALSQHSESSGLTSKKPSKQERENPSLFLALSRYCTPGTGTRSPPAETQATRGGRSHPQDARGAGRAPHGTARTSPRCLTVRMRRLPRPRPPARSGAGGLSSPRAAVTAQGQTPPSAPVPDSGRPRPFWMLRITNDKLRRGPSDY